MKPAIKDMNMAMKILERQLSGRDIIQGLFTDTCNKTRTLNCRNLSARPKCHCWTGSITFSNKGTVFAAGVDFRVLIWSIDAVLGSKMQPVATVMQSKHKGAVACIALSNPDDQYIFSCDDTAILIHDINTYNFILL